MHFSSRHVYSISTDIWYTDLVFFILFLDLENLEKKQLPPDCHIHLLQIYLIHAYLVK